MNARPEDTALNRRHRVVVIGSGFGGLFAVKKPRRADVDITLIGGTTRHLFQPLLLPGGDRHRRHGRGGPGLRVILRGQRNAQVLLGEVTRSTRRAH